MQERPLAKTRARFRRTLRITFAWVVVGLIAALFERVVLLDQGVRVTFATIALDNTIMALVMGLVVGGTYIFLLRDRLRHLAFLPAFAIVSIGMLLFMIALVFLLPENGSVITEDSTGLWRTLGPWRKGFQFYWVLLMGATMLVVRLEDQYGSGALNYLTGRYYKPREELRVFMFLDMRSSTTIAERIGHVKYFQLLNDVYADITDPVVYSRGEIYQYVGDEVSVSWKLRRALRHHQCIRCFFDIRERLARKAPYYNKRYGLVPQFKAGFHYGEVTTGEVGLLKKEVIFSGDVVNTAARIQNTCNDHNVDLLISKDLLDLLRLPTDIYTCRPIGEISLKGKTNEVSLWTVQRMEDTANELEDAPNLEASV